MGPYYIPKEGDIVTLIEEYGNKACYVNDYYVGDEAFIEKYCTTTDDGLITVSVDCYFALGDNCNNSKDSRYLKNQYIRSDKIIGRAVFRILPRPSVVTKK